jgi:hypothetical protein
LVALAFSSPARAQENFYQGRTIRLIVGSAPGGRYAMGMRPETAEKAEKEQEPSGGVIYKRL